MTRAALINPKPKRLILAPPRKRGGGREVRPHITSFSPHFTSLSFPLNSNSCCCCVEATLTIVLLQGLFTYYFTFLPIVLHSSCSLWHQPGAIHILEELCTCAHCAEPNKNWHVFLLSYAFLRLLIKFLCMVYIATLYSHSGENSDLTQGFLHCCNFNAIFLHCRGS